jgi:hypothetical protein
MDFSNSQNRDFKSKFRLLFTVVLVFNIVGVFAQQAVLSSGKAISKDGYSVSYSIGELAVQTHESSGAILTQGQQQGSLIVTAIGTPRLSGFTLKAYPNPVKEYITLDIQKGPLSDLKLRLSTITGVTLENREIDSNSETIQMNQYNGGIYLLQVTGRGGQPIQTFKIVKQ